MMSSSLKSKEIIFLFGLILNSLDFLVVKKQQFMFLTKSTTEKSQL